MISVTFVNRDLEMLPVDVAKDLKFAALIGEDSRSFRTWGGQIVTANCYVSVVPFIRGVSRNDALRYMKDLRNKNPNCLYVSLLTKEQITFLRGVDASLADFPQEDCLLSSSIVSSRGDVDAWWIWDGHGQSFRLERKNEKSNLYLFFCLPKDCSQKLFFL